MRDELRELLPSRDAAETIRMALLQAGWSANGVPVEQAHIDIRRAVDAALPSLPAGGGDGRRWTVTVDAEGKLRGIGDKTDSVPPAVVKRTGLRVIEVVEAPASSSAGDEAREALGYEAMADRIADAAFERTGRSLDRPTLRAGLAALSLPLPGAGDAREEWRIVAADGTPRSTGPHSTPESLGPPSEWDDDFLGGPHRYQRRRLVATPWEDVSSLSGDGEENER